MGNVNGWTILVNTEALFLLSCRVWAHSVTLALASNTLFFSESIILSEENREDQACQWNNTETSENYLFSRMKQLKPRDFQDKGRV